MKGYVHWGDPCHTVEYSNRTHIRKTAPRHSEGAIRREQGILEPKVMKEKLSFLPSL